MSRAVNATVCYWLIVQFICEGLARVLYHCYSSLHSWCLPYLSGPGACRQLLVRISFITMTMANFISPNGQFKFWKGAQLLYMKFYLQKKFVTRCKYEQVTEKSICSGIKKNAGSFLFVDDKKKRHLKPIIVEQIWKYLSTPLLATFNTFHIMSCRDHLLSLSLYQIRTKQIKCNSHLWWLTCELEKHSCCFGYFYHLCWITQKNTLFLWQTCFSLFKSSWKIVYKRVRILHLQFSRWCRQSSVFSSLSVMTAWCFQTSWIFARVDPFTSGTLVRPRQLFLLYLWFQLDANNCDILSNTIF